MKVIVAAHPRRRPAVNRIVKHLGRQTAVAWDPDPEGAPSAIRTYRAALELAGADAALILQDDAVPHGEIGLFADAALRTNGYALVALYVGDKHGGGPQITRAARRGERYAPMPLGHFVPTVALAWPAGAAAEFAAWIDRADLRPEQYQDDEAVKLWRLAHGRDAIRAVCSIPSVCRHDNDLPSLLNHGAHGHRDALMPWDTFARADWRERW